MRCCSFTIIWKIKIHSKKKPWENICKLSSNVHVYGLQMFKMKQILNRLGLKLEGIILVVGCEYEVWAYSTMWHLVGIFKLKQLMQKNVHVILVSNVGFRMLIMLVYWRKSLKSNLEALQGRLFSRFVGSNLRWNGMIVYFHWLM